MRSELLAHRTLTPKLLQKPGIVPGCCARRRDERLRMRSELLAHRTLTPKLLQNPGSYRATARAGATSGCECAASCWLTEP